jgi:hypothetical protein
MPGPIDLKPLADAELVRVLGKVKPIAAKYPKKATTAAEFKAAQKKWIRGQAAPAAPKVKEGAVKAVKLTSAQVGRLRAIRESTSPTAEAIVGQKMGPDEILGTLYSSLSALEFSRLESEFKTRRAKALTPVAQKKVQAEWAKVVSAGQAAYAAAGLKGVTERDLLGFAKELHASKPNLNAVVDIANSATVAAGGVSATLSGRTTISGGWLTHVAVLPDLAATVVTIAGLCDKPFAEGTFTRHFSKSFSLKVRLRVWCPTWTNPFRTCVKEFTLAGVSFSVGLNVGYRVTCCGATAWGQAHAQACGTIVGVTVCAGCTATVTGVSGIGHSTSGSQCTYGIGLNARLQCTFAGITVFSVQVPFGFNVVGPCPPAGLCN